MKIPIKLALILTLSFGFSIRGMAQSAGQTVQQAGNCSVNLTGNGAANVSCTRVVDATLADQIQTILKIVKRNENADKDIKEKLDHIIAQTSGEFEDALYGIVSGHRRPHKTAQ